MLNRISSNRGPFYLIIGIILTGGSYLLSLSHQETLEEGRDLDFWGYLVFFLVPLSSLIGYLLVIIGIFSFDYPRKRLSRNIENYLARFEGNQAERKRPLNPIREANLPGVGHKFQIETMEGDRLTIIIHDDGRRELYHFTRQDPNKVASVVTLDDSQARQVAAIIGGLTYVPKALPSTEIVLEDLVLEWFSIPPNAASLGRTIRDFQVRKETGATIVLIIEEDGRKIINPEADTRLNPEATLIIAGDRKSLKAAKDLLLRGSTR